MKFWVSGVVLALAVAGCSAAPEADDDGFAEQESAVESRTDRADIPFRVIDGFTVPSTVGSTETRRVFTSARAFESYFGVRAPGVNFGREWVAFYSAGTQRTGGYRASFQRIRPSASGLTLKLTTRLESPGRDCIVTQALTRPSVLVAFRIPSSDPPYARFYRDDTTRSCAPEQYTCATLDCRPGHHCEMVPVQCVRAPCPAQPTCIPDRCPGAGTRNPTTGLCECNALGVCVTGSRWNADPAVCACTSLCDSARCPSGTRCEVRGNAVACVPVVDPCATVRCAAGTHCEATNGRASCVPDLTCAAVLCITGTTCVMRDGRPVCEPIAGACSRDSDCRLSDNYCGGCACDALGPGQRPATCSNPVQCFRQPCQGMAARCNPDTRRCEAVRATAGAACGRTTCPSGMVCCNASCGICTPPGGACIQLACTN